MNDSTNMILTTNENGKKRLAHLPPALKKYRTKRKIRTEHLPEVLEDLDAINKKKKIKLRVRELEGEIYSLYLHAQYNHKQKQYTLNLYIHGSDKSKKQDEETLKLAMAIREKKEIEIDQDVYNFRFKNEYQNKNFMEYYKKVIIKKNDSNPNWKSTEKHLKAFIKKENIQIRDIDQKFCQNFYNYLNKNVNLNSSWQYFNRFRYVLKQIHDEGIINENPANRIKVKKEEVDKVFLILDEVKILNDTPYSNQVIKNAFLFSCWTGLRISDIEKLIWSEIQGEYIVFRQKKTRGLERMKLHKNAIEILRNQKLISKNNIIFNLPPRTTIRYNLKKWFNAAGLKKNITIHSARHTFATLLLTFDVDIFSIMKLMGHSKIETTLAYAKLIDKKKDEAIDKLPKI